jgi:hypothetical protein
MDCALPISPLTRLNTSQVTIATKQVAYKPGKDAFHRVPNLLENMDMAEGVLTLSERWAWV